MKRSWGVIVVAAAVAIQFAPVLGGRVYRFEDIGGYFEPLWAAAARQMASGHLPVWDRGAWSGQFLVGDPQAGIFYPPNWLWLVLPVLRAYAVLAMVHALWAGAGMYFLCRTRGRSHAAAALAGIALAVSGYVVLQVRHIHFVETTAWVPWVAAFGLRALRSRRQAAPFAVALAMLLLSGGVSMVLYGAWFVAALLFVALLQRPASSRVADVAWWTVGGAVAVALAAPMLAPMLAHARLSPRALGLDPTFAASGAWPNYGFFATLFLPNLLGDAAAGTYRGGFVQWELCGYYAGLLPFVLAICFLVAGPRARRSERWLVGALLFFAVLLARGDAVYRAAYRVLPLLSSTRCPARALYLFTLAVPLFAAEGLDQIAARIPPSRRALFSWAAAAIVALDLLVTHRRENPSQTLAEAAVRPEAVAFLERAMGKQTDRFINDVHIDHALHNAGLEWGLEGASGYNSLPLWRYLHLLWIANHGAPYRYERLHDDLSAQGLWRFDSPIVDLLAVRWVLTHDPPNGGHFVKRFTADHDGIDVWENLEALPRAFVVHHARFAKSDDEAARAMADLKFDLHREAVVEGASQLPLSEGGVDSVDAVRIVSPSATTIDVQLDRPGLLVVAEPYHPEARALVDGAPTPILATDYALRGVPLAAGRHHVELDVENASVAQGLLAALLGVCVLVLLLIRAPRAPVSPA